VPDPEHLIDQEFSAPDPPAEPVSSLLDDGEDPEEPSNDGGLFDEELSEPEEDSEDFFDPEAGQDDELFGPEDRQDDDPSSETAEEKAQDRAESEPADPDDEWEAVSLLDTVRSHPVAVVVVGGMGVLALVACMVFLVGRLQHASNSLALPSPVPSVPSTNTPAKAAPNDPPTKSRSPASVPPSTTARAPDNATAAEPDDGDAASSDGTAGTSDAPTPVAGATGTTATGPCNPSDVTVTTATDSSSYSPGAQVKVTSRLVDDAACAFTPVQSGEYSCPATVLVVDGSGSQVYPMSGQKEQCADVPSETLAPGTVVTVTSAWPQQVMGTTGPGQAPSGQYRAQVIWIWSSGGGAAPYEVTADSPPFSVGS
jgi:hypothetical protein